MENYIFVKDIILSAFAIEKTEAILDLLWHLLIISVAQYFTESYQKFFRKWKLFVGRYSVWNGHISDTWSMDNVLIHILVSFWNIDSSLDFQNFDLLLITTLNSMRKTCFTKIKWKNWTLRKMLFPFVLLSSHSRPAGMHTNHLLSTTHHWFSIYEPIFHLKKKMISPNQCQRPIFLRYKSLKYCNGFESD